MSALLHGILRAGGPRAFLTTALSGHDDWLPISGGVDDRVFAPGDEVTYEEAHDIVEGPYATNVQQVYP